MINYTCGLNALGVAGSLKRNIHLAEGMDGDKVNEDHWERGDDGEIEG